MRIKALKKLALLNRIVSIDEEADLPDHQANVLIRMGVAVLAGEPNGPSGNQVNATTE